MKLCSEKCQITHQRHDNEECVLVKRVKDKNFDQWLSVLRVLKLRKSNPKLWTSFNMLEDHREDRKECQIMKQNKSSIVFIISNTQSLILFFVLKNFMFVFVDTKWNFFWESKLTKNAVYSSKSQCAALGKSGNLFVWSMFRIRSFRIGCLIWWTYLQFGICYIKTYPNW